MKSPSVLYRPNTSVSVSPFVSLIQINTKSTPKPQVIAKTQNVQVLDQLNKLLVPTAKIKVKVQLIKVPMATPLSFITSLM